MSVTLICNFYANIQCVGQKIAPMYERVTALKSDKPFEPPLGLIPRRQDQRNLPNLRSQSHKQSQKSFKIWEANRTTSWFHSTCRTKRSFQCWESDSTSRIKKALKSEKPIEPPHGLIPQAESKEPSNTENPIPQVESKKFWNLRSQLNQEGKEFVIEKCNLIVWHEKW